MVGRIVDQYRIVSKLGQGGMGDVYLAEDRVLHRRVAIKFLPAHVGDADSMARFRREAQAAAALEHPNIVAVHHVGEVDGRPYIVMAFVEGETLAAALSGGALPTARVVDLTRQIAEALSAAHRAGVIHRDIKPGNIVLTSTGRALVLDFGLAKLHGASHVTGGDTTLGTARYMAPEQIRGEAVDGRSDVFSLGAVLYDMLCGRVAFRGDHRESIFYSILNEVPAAPVSGDDPLRGRLASIAMRALEKRAADRYPSVDVMLADLSAATSIDERTAGRSWRASRHVITATVAIAVAAILLLLWRSRGRDGSTGDGPPVRAGLGPLTTVQVTFDPRLEEWSAWSTDGSQIAYAGEVNGFAEIWVRPAGPGDGEQITRDGKDKIQLAWSPSGASIAFVQCSLPSGKLAPADVFGYYLEGGDICVLDRGTGVTTKLIDDAFNPSYSPDGTQIAFDAAWAGPRRIWMADVRGRNPRQLTTDESDAVSHVDPAWSPDGRWIVYRRSHKTRTDIEMLDVHTRQAIRLTNDWFIDLQPTWAPGARHVYFSSYRGGALNVWRVSVLDDRVGTPEQVTTGAGDDLQPTISPDGTRLAFCVMGLNSDLWRMPMNPASGRPTGVPEPFVATTRADSRGAWSPDGRTVAFNSDRSGSMNLWLHNVDGGRERALTTGPGGDYQANWCPDGRTIAFFSGRSGNADIWTIDTTAGEPRRLTTDPGLDINPFYSPDGKRIAFHSDRSGRAEPWVMSADGSGARRLANVEASGHFMRWFDRGRRIIFLSGEGADRVIYSVRVEDGTLEAVSNIVNGAHMSFSPDESMVLEVAGHRVLWTCPLVGEKPSEIFEFDEPDIRIDYPVWSPDGRWALFDRVAPQGGDIWVLNGLK